MRLYHELSAIEEGVIDLDCGIALLRSIIAGAETQRPEQIQDALYGLERYLESNHEQLKDAFEMAWNEDLRCEIKECLN
jgi:hypothetical protein